MEVNTITCSAAISACEKVGEWLKTLELLSTMVQGRVQVNTITYSAVISACEKGGESRLPFRVIFNFLFSKKLIFRIAKIKLIFICRRKGC